ncbi:hypothetical protein ACUNV4_12890 [Granulosicoccus sp. 3-233]|uniref:hypothetical protein n=1 Tax=Granulosicoccus sp. 3-233 TaxID=3417969 RepID=UPI003D348676
MTMRSGKLLLALCLGLISLLAIAWFDRMTAHRTETLRLARSELQTLQLQMNLLQTPDMGLTLAHLEEDLDALRIRLVELLTQHPRPEGVLAVEFEQSILPRALQDAGAETVRVLRLELEMVVQHAVAFLEMLARVDEAVPVWPHEVQACMIHRKTPEGLQLACVLDFYHWQASERQASMPISSELEAMVERAP